MSEWSRFRRDVDRDRGATAILVAASLLLLMGFAAIAVDAGIGFSERRQQSSASDVGALAALQFAKTTLGGVMHRSTRTSPRAVVLSKRGM